MMETCSTGTSFAMSIVSGLKNTQPKGETRTFGAHCESRLLPTMAGSTFAQHGPLTGVGGPMDEGEASIAG